MNIDTSSHSRLLHISLFIVYNNLWLGHQLRLLAVLLLRWVICVLVPLILVKGLRLLLVEVWLLLDVGWLLLVVVWLLYVLVVIHWQNLLDF